MLNLSHRATPLIYAQGTAGVDVNLPLQIATANVAGLGDIKGA